METSYLNRAKQIQVPQKNDKKHIIIALILASILVVVFFTQGVVDEYMASSDAIDTASGKLSAVTAELANLKKIEAGLGDVKMLEDVKKYAAPFREDEILTAVFEPSIAGSIQNVTISKGQKMPNGLSQADVNVSLTVSTKEQIMTYMQYLTDIKNTKRFVIKSVDYPFSAGDEGGSVALQLGVYYYAK